MKIDMKTFSSFEELEAVLLANGLMVRWRYDAYGATLAVVDLARIELDKADKGAKMAERCADLLSACTGLTCRYGGVLALAVDGARCGRVELMPL